MAGELGGVTWTFFSLNTFAWQRPFGEIAKTTTFWISTVNRAWARVLHLVFRSSGRVNQHLHMKTVQNRASFLCLCAYVFGNFLQGLRHADSPPLVCYMPDGEMQMLHHWQSMILDNEITRDIRQQSGQLARMRMPGASRHIVRSVLPLPPFV